MPTNLGLLSLAVVFCGLLAGWLFFQNGLRKNDPGKDLIRGAVGVVLCFGPFVWSLVLYGTDMEHSLILLCVTGGCSFVVSQCLQTQSKYVGGDAGGLLPVSVLSIALSSTLLLACAGLIWYSEYHQQTQVEAKKAAPPTSPRK